MSVIGEPFSSVPGPDGVSFAVINVTPEMAKEWIESRARNRRVKQRLVLAYAADMKAGRWTLTHQGLAFDTNGQLIDGQHRLLAVILADMPVRFMVTSGLGKVAQLNCDNHGKRDAADSLKIAGFDTDQEEVAIARCMATRSFRGVDEKVASIGGLSEYLQAHKEAIVFASQITRPKVRGVSIAPVAAAVARAFYNEDRDRLAAFVTVLITGMPEEPVFEDSAALRLRQSLQAGDTGGAKGWMISRRTFLRTSGACRLFCRREGVRRIQCPENDVYLLPGERREKSTGRILTGAVAEVRP